MLPDDILLEIPTFYVGEAQDIEALQLPVHIHPGTNQDLTRSRVDMRPQLLERLALFDMSRTTDLSALGMAPPSLLKLLQIVKLTLRLIRHARLPPTSRFAIVDTPASRLQLLHLDRIFFSRLFCPLITSSYFFQRIFQIMNTFGRGEGRLPHHLYQT